MSAPTVEALLAALQAETARRVAAERTLASVAGARALQPVRWLHRLTGRGPDLAAAERPAASPTGSEAFAHVDARQVIIDDFHRLYYHSTDTWQNTRWIGSDVWKLPLDLWLYQEFLFDRRPDVVIECGTYMGGSALFMAHVMDLIGHGEIVTIDLVERPGRPEHPRITYVGGSSTDPAIVADVAARVDGRSKMFILDSDHSEAHVYAELQAYAPLVGVGELLIVEDTNVHGRPVFPEHPAGPGEARDRFLAERDDFEVLPGSEKFLVSFNPGGVLVRVR